MVRRKNGALGSNKGVAIVEFAIVVPLLVLLVFGMIEFGVMLYDKAMITNASREGARAGVVFNRLTADQITTVVQGYVGANLITFGTPATVAVTMNPTDPTTLDSGDLLTVNVSYAYNFLVMPSFLSQLAGGVNLTASSIMRAE